MKSAPLLVNGMLMVGLCAAGLAGCAAEGEQQVQPEGRPYYHSNRTGWGDGYVEPPQRDPRLEQQTPSGEMLDEDLRDQNDRHYA